MVGPENDGAGFTYFLCSLGMDTRLLTTKRFFFLFNWHTFNKIGSESQFHVLRAAEGPLFVFLSCKAHPYTHFNTKYTNSVQQLEAKTSSQTLKSGRVPMTQLGGLDARVPPQPLVGPRPMKKYTGNGQAPQNINPTGLVS